MWFNEKYSFYILGKKRFLYSGIYVFQEIISTLKGINKFFYVLSLYPGINKKLLIYTTFIKKFNIEEILILKFFNIYTFKDIRRFIPGDLSIYLHYFNRRNLIRKSFSARKLLADKYKTLKLCPKDLKYEHILISFFCMEATKKLNNSFLNLKKHISNEGIVIKPRYGSLNKNILFIQQEGKFLCIKKINSDFIYKLEKIKGLISIENLLEALEKVGYEEKEFLIMPYLSNNNKFIYGANFVFRIITKFDFSKKEITIYSKWLEVHYKIDKILFMDLDTNIVQKEHNTFSAKENEMIFEIKKFISENPNKIFDRTLEAAKKMHSLIEDIDYIAWDFIPTENGPKLLEGNSDFNIFFPQLFHYLSNKKKKNSQFSSMINLY